MVRPSKKSKLPELKSGVGFALRVLSRTYSGSLRWAENLTNKSPPRLRKEILRSEELPGLCNFPRGREITSIRPALRLAVPAMFFQFGEQAGIERAGVAGGDVLAHVFRVAHAHDRGAHRGMRQDEAQ
jgi:hypothetical protein